jgi:hypothetical protein
LLLLQPWQGTQPEDSGTNGEWRGFDSREAAFKAASAMDLEHEGLRGVRAMNY